MAKTQTVRRSSVTGKFVTRSTRRRTSPTTEAERIKK